MENDEQEAVHDAVAAEVRVLPRENVLEALDEVIGSSKKRKQESVYILSELSDVPGVVERVGQWLRDPDPQIRSWLIQVVESKRLLQFASLLKSIVEHDPDPFCRDLAIHASGTLKAKESLPALIHMAEQNDTDFIDSLAWALKDYASEECRPHLQRWFRDCSQSKSTRVISAWGVAKLGDNDAVRYLIEMLRDPDKRGPTFFEPGESVRAAQALCDIHNWPFQWHKSSVANTIELLKRAGLIEHRG